MRFKNEVAITIKCKCAKNKAIRTQKVRSLQVECYIEVKCS